MVIVPANIVRATMSSIVLGDECSSGFALPQLRGRPVIGVSEEPVEPIFLDQSQLTPRQKVKKNLLLHRGQHE